MYLGGEYDVCKLGNFCSPLYEDLSSKNRSLSRGRMRTSIGADYSATYRLI